MQDRAGIEQFAAAQLSSLLRPAYYLTGDWDFAQGLVQATLVKMCGAWDRLKPDVDRVAYARTVLLNVYRDHARSERRRAFGLVRVPPPAAAAEADLAERDYQRELLLQLPPKQVYDGPAPAGCQPDMRIATVDVTQAGRHVQYQSYCDVVTTEAQTKHLTFSPAVTVDDDLTTGFAELAPVRSVDPPLDDSLQLELITPVNKANTTQTSIAGTIIVTQDGTTIHIKRLAAGQHSTVQLRQGTYTLTASAPGHQCPPLVVTLYGHELTGPSPSCTKG